MFDSFVDAFDFNPMEVGNPMTLGMMEEEEESRCNYNYSDWNDDTDDNDADDDYYWWR